VILNASIDPRKVRGVMHLAGWRLCQVENALNRRHSTFANWLRLQRMPRGALEQLAALLGVGVEVLQPKIDQGDGQAGGGRA
jgi:hypothetical protein